jgi:hypothetical protein
MKSDSPIDYLFAPDHTPEWSDWTSTGIHVTRMVIGTQGSSMDLGSFPALAALFPNLKALHLFGLADLSTIPSLPPQLEILDIRNCPDLTTIPPLPETLADLVLDDLPALSSLSTKSATIALHDVAIVKCSAIPEGQIHQLLSEILSSSRGRTLGCLDLSGCPQVTTLPTELPNFTRIILNDCKGLSRLPGQMPPKLTRLDLANTDVSELNAEITDAIDYLDLRGCRRLGRLPSRWCESERPSSSAETDRKGTRTLYLSESAVKSPPATLHGTGTQNVAQGVRNYFREIKEVGSGSFRRCKILLLGNGYAGKTTLSLSLEGKEKTEDHDSTHGIRLVNWPKPGIRDGIDRMIWDFGGQEIYHNTHSIFLKTNAIFVILWDGKMCKPARSDDEHWRPLNYWIDYIVNYGPVAPRIAIVYNQWEKTIDKQTESNTAPDELKQKLRKQILKFTDPRKIKCELFILDAEKKEGDYGEFAAWAERSTKELAHDQGEEVPCYWEIAAAIVDYWTAKDEPKELNVEDFGKTMESVFRLIAEGSGPEPRWLAKADIKGVSLVEAANGWRNRFTKFARLLKEDKFTLTAERVEFLLEFLHHSGLVYWKRDKFGNKVIISQRWALDGIYTILSRDEDHFKILKQANGVFNYNRIESFWETGQYNPDQKRLLMNYMEQAGACFAIVPENERPGRDTVYLSLAHLSSMAERELHPNWDEEQAKKAFPSKLLHLGHWHAILRALGQDYGREAEYASDGFVFHGREKQTVIVWAEIHSDGIGGVIHLLVKHPSDERQNEIERKMAALIRREVPLDDKADPEGSEARDPVGSLPAGEADRRPRVFISYASPPKPTGNNQGVLSQYTDSPEFVRETIGKLTIPGSSPGEAIRFKPIFDQDEKEGMGIREFVDLCKQCDWMIMITSDRYWKSPWCLYEFISTRDSKGSNLFGVSTIAIKIEDCGVDDPISRSEYRKLFMETHQRLIQYRNNLSNFLHLSSEEKEVFDKLEKMEDSRVEYVRSSLDNALTRWWNECWNRADQRCNWNDGKDAVRKIIEKNLQKKNSRP